MLDPDVPEDDPARAPVADPIPAGFVVVGGIQGQLRVRVRMRKPQILEPLILRPVVVGRVPEMPVVGADLDERPGALVGDLRAPEAVPRREFTDEPVAASGDMERRGYSIFASRQKERLADRVI